MNHPSPFSAHSKNLLGANGDNRQNSALQFDILPNAIKNLLIKNRQLKRIEGGSTTTT
jgi:hypothetical protein